MAKKKKTALKPAVNRGFATTSTPSKRPDQSRPQTSQSTSGTNTPTDEEKRNIAQAIEEIVVGGDVNRSKDDTDPRMGMGEGAQFDPEKEEEQALQNLVERLREKVDKDVARVWKVSAVKGGLRVDGHMHANEYVSRGSSLTVDRRNSFQSLRWTRNYRRRSSLSSIQLAKRSLALRLAASTISPVFSL